LAIRRDVGARTFDVSALCKHPIGDLLAITEETAQAMWRSYDEHMRHPSSDPEWERRAWVMYQECMTCSQRVWRLKEMRERAFGLREDGSAG
jgi:hypothetical protein